MNIYTNYRSTFQKHLKLVLLLGLCCLIFFGLFGLGLFFLLLLLQEFLLLKFPAYFIYALLGLFFGRVLFDGHQRLQLVLDLVNAHAVDLHVHAEEAIVLRRV